MKTVKYSGLVIGGLAVILTGFYLALEIWGSWHDEWSGYNWEYRWEISDGWCNVAVVPIIGNITTEPVPEGGNEYAVTNADETSQYLERANWDENIDAIMIRIDSYGGYPVAGEIITNAVKRSELPTVALIREAGVSSGYMIASAADHIIASPMSDVGSIGVTMSYVGNWEENAAAGRTYVDLTSAPFKDYGNPEKPLTPEERVLLERDLGILHDYFVQMVSDNRQMPLDQIKELADGSSMPGALALQKGLIDQTGDQETAREWLAAELGIPTEEVMFCE